MQEPGVSGVGKHAAKDACYKAQSLGITERDHREGPGDGGCRRWVTKTLVGAKAEVTKSTLRSGTAFSARP